MTIGSKDKPLNRNLIAEHGYSLLTYVDIKGKMYLYLRNPHGEKR